MPTTLDRAGEYVGERVRSRRFGARTGQQARYQLTSFAAVAPDDPTKITRRHVEKWLASGDHAPSYVRARLVAVRGFSRWLVERDFAPRDFTVGVLPPKVPELAPRALRAEEVDLVIAKAPDARVRLMCLLMVQEGLRRAEVAAIHLEDIGWRDRTLGVRGKGGGGQVTDAVPVTDQTWRALMQYLDGAQVRHGPLFRSMTSGRQVSPSRVGELVRETMIAAGVKRYPGDGRSAHALRHTAAHELLERTGDIYAVKRALRHRSVKNTEVYLRGMAQDLRPVTEGRWYGPDVA